MIVRRFFEPQLAQSSYLVGCAACGEAIVIDPNRNTDTYTSAAAADNLKIAYVTETHIHADFLSGSRELASRTGATLLLSDEGDADWKYGFASEGRLIRSGDRIAVGNVRIDVLHTPGHTPEHLTFLITDGAVADAPIAAVTGDFVFVGDVGRPDLLERAANLKGTMESGARALYRSLQAFNRHEEWLQVWPGHGAGSSCGKGISAVPHSTLGYERRFNWAFRMKSETEFVDAVLTGQPDPPKYFATMKRMNKEGPRVIGDAARAVVRKNDAELASVIARGGLVIDTRAAAEYATGFVPGTINLPINNAFVTWAGWLIPYDQEFDLLLGDGAETRLAEIARALALIGLDRIGGYFASSALATAARSLPLGVVPQIAPETLAQMRGDHVPVVIDVRADSEWMEGHLPAAVHIPLGRLADRVAELPRGQPLVMQCGTGARSAIAASVLRRAGFADVSNLVGGCQAWVAAGLPTSRGGPSGPP
jgi:hydroxyacylglutathione hydrolase